MSTALVSKEDWTVEQKALIKSQICKDATDDELKLFLYVAKRTGLDPFARQIYAVKRKNSRGELQMTVQTSIDGFRLTAFRTDCYAGRDEAIFEYDDKGAPKKVKVTVYKLVQGIRCAFTATALWSEYYPGEVQGFMWKKLPETMLEKCCEAKALRMAFPAELSGIYSKEEMDQADATQARVAPSQPGPEDGFQKPGTGTFIKYGRFANQYLNQVDPSSLREWIEFEESKAAQAGKELTPWMKKIVAEAEPIIAAYESGQDPSEESA